MMVWVMQLIVVLFCYYITQVTHFGEAARRSKSIYILGVSASLLLYLIFILLVFKQVSQALLLLQYIRKKTYQDRKQEHMQTTAARFKEAYISSTAFKYP
jgi:hypothetical protein